MISTSSPISEEQDVLEAMGVLEHLAGFTANSRKPAADAATQQRGAMSANSNRRGKWQPDLRYRSLVERLPVVTFMASLDERHQGLYVGPQIESLLGFTQQEWLENPILWFEQLHPDDRDRWVEAFARTCATG